MESGVEIEIFNLFRTIILTNLLEWVSIWCGGENPDVLFVKIRPFFEVANLFSPSENLIKRGKYSNFDGPLNLRKIPLIMNNRNTNRQYTRDEYSMAEW